MIKIKRDKESKGWWRIYLPDVVLIFCRRKYIGWHNRNQTEVLE